MIRPFVYGLLSLPFTALSAPILENHTHNRTVLEVEYWGTLDQAEGAPPPARELHNKLRIDLSLAPRDQDSAPSLGVYGWTPGSDWDGCPCDTADFVSTGLQKLGGQSRDYVELDDDHRDGRKNAFDSFIIHNNARSENAAGGMDLMRLNLAVFAQTDFLHGDLLDQAFDLRPDNDPIVHGLGSVFEDVGGKLRAYTFAIQRLRVTPLVCKP